MNNNCIFSIAANGTFLTINDLFMPVYLFHPPIQIDYQRDLSGECAQLMLEYNKIHTSIDTEWMHTYIPECWAAFVPLKAEYYKGAYYY